MKLFFKTMITHLFSTIIVSLPIALISTFLLYKFIGFDFKQTFTIIETLLLNIYFLKVL